MVLVSSVRYSDEGLSQGGMVTLSDSRGSISPNTRRKAGWLRIAKTLPDGIGELCNHLTHRGRENASVWNRGRRWRSSQMPTCNGLDRTKDHQDRHWSKYLSLAQIKGDVHG